MSQVARLRLGLVPWALNANQDAESLCLQAEQAEAWGYDSLWLPESHFGGDYSIPDPLMLLAAIAARTSTLHLATTSFLITLRHPLQAAEQVATLDKLCNGRLILGLGRGFHAPMLDAFNIEAKEKRHILEKNLQIMQQAWSGQHVGSEHHQAVLSPLPAQRPHPPLWMAAFGPKALQQAARLHMPYLASPMETLGQLQQNIAVYRESLTAHDLADTGVCPVMRTVYISDDKAACDTVRENLIQSAIAANIPTPEAVDDRAFIGPASKVKDDVQRYREQLGMDYLIAVRPRVSGLSPANCAASMQSLIEACQA